MCTKVTEALTFYLITRKMQKKKNSTDLGSNTI